MPAQQQAVIVARKLGQFGSRLQVRQKILYPLLLGGQFFSNHFAQVLLLVVATIWTNILEV
jgi:hypothetical protein